MKFSFDSFADGSFDYDCKTKNHTCLWLREANMDIGGGTISKEEIDSRTNKPDIDVVTISGLRQDTFEYFIKNYGKQLRAIRFSKTNLLKIGLCLVRSLNLNTFISFSINAFLHYGICARIFL